MKNRKKKSDIKDKEKKKTLIIHTDKSYDYLKLMKSERQGEKSSKR